MEIPYNSPNFSFFFVVFPARLESPQYMYETIYTCVDIIRLHRQSLHKIQPVSYLPESRFFTIQVVQSGNIQLLRANAREDTIQSTFH